MFRTEISMLDFSICIKYIHIKLDSLGNKDSKNCNVSVFLSCKKDQVKNTIKFLFQVLKCLKYKDRRRFLGDGYEKSVIVVSCCGYSLKRFVILPKRTVLKVCPFYLIYKLVINKSPIKCTSLSKEHYKASLKRQVFI